MSGVQAVEAITASLQELIHSLEATQVRSCLTSTGGIRLLVVMPLRHPMDCETAYLPERSQQADAQAQLVHITPLVP